MSVTSPGSIFCCQASLLAPTLQLLIASSAQMPHHLVVTLPAGLLAQDQTRMQKVENAHSNRHRDTVQHHLVNLRLDQVSAPARRQLDRAKDAPSENHRARDEDRSQDERPFPPLRLVHAAEPLSLLHRGRSGLVESRRGRDAACACARTVNGSHGSVLLGVAQFGSGGPLFSRSLLGGCNLAESKAVWSVAHHTHGKVDAACDEDAHSYELEDDTGHHDVGRRLCGGTARSA